MREPKLLNFTCERRHPIVHSELRTSAQQGGTASPRTSTARPLQGLFDLRPQGHQRPAGETCSTRLYGTSAAATTLDTSRWSMKKRSCTVAQQDNVFLKCAGWDGRWKDSAMGQQGWL